MSLPATVARPECRHLPSGIRAAVAARAACQALETQVLRGGLFTSTVLNLFVLPTLALRFGRFAAPATETIETVPHP